MAIEKQKLILIGGVVLGITAIFMTKTFLDQQKQAAQEQAKKMLDKIKASQAVVLVAKKDIPKDSIMEASMFDNAIVPEQFIQPQAATSMDRVLGMRNLAPISKGEQISLTKLAKAVKEENRGSGSRLAGNTPSGKRAISIVVDNIASLAGMVKPGDYVDVLATLQIPMQDLQNKMSSQMVVVPLFQNVLVLAIGQDIGFGDKSESRYDEKKAAAAPPSGLITLALAPQETNLMAFVQEQGKMRLTLRSPADAKVEPMSPASWESLFQYIIPPSSGDGASAAVPVDTTEYVEVLRGLNKERVALPK